MRRAEIPCRHDLTIYTHPTPIPPNPKLSIFPILIKVLPFIKRDESVLRKKKIIMHFQLRDLKRPKSIFVFSEKLNLNIAQIYEEKNGIKKTTSLRKPHNEKARTIK